MLHVGKVTVHFRKKKTMYITTASGNTQVFDTMAKPQPPESTSEKTPYCGSTVCTSTPLDFLIWPQTMATCKSSYMFPWQQTWECVSSHRQGLTCTGGVGGLEEAHHTLSMEACGAQQYGLGAGAPPADHREAALSVASRNPLQGGVLDALRYDEQPGVAKPRERSFKHKDRLTCSN